MNRPLEWHVRNKEVREWRVRQKNVQAQVNLWESLSLYVSVSLPPPQTFLCLVTLVWKLFGACLLLHVCTAPSTSGAQLGPLSAPVT